MSATTAAKLVYRLRVMLKDESISQPVHSLPAVLDAIDRAVFAVSGRLPGYVGINASFLSLTAGANSYTITETDVHTINALRISDTGQTVWRVSMPLLMRYRSSNPDASADPLLVSFTETAAGVVKAELWPTPNVARTLTALIASAPTVTFQGLASADLTATSLNFGPYGTRAIEYRAAAELVGLTTPEGQAYMGMSTAAIRDEGYRMDRLRRSGAMAENPMGSGNG